MAADALFSDAVARDVFAAPARAAAHLCCRFCGSDRPGTRECCLRIAGRGAGDHAVGRVGENFTVVCCRACSARTAALELARFAAVGWAVVAAGGAVALAFAGAWPLALAALAGAAPPALAYRVVARRRTAALLGADRDARLRRKVGVRNWGLTTAVTLRRDVPPGEPAASLDGV